MSSVPGFDTSKLDALDKFAFENPENAMLGLEVTTIWEGYAVENLGKIGPWELGGERIAKSVTSRRPADLARAVLGRLVAETEGS